MTKGTFSSFKIAVACFGDYNTLRSHEELGHKTPDDTNCSVLRRFALDAAGLLRPVPTKVWPTTVTTPSRLSRSVTTGSAWAGQRWLGPRQSQKYQILVRIFVCPVVLAGKPLYISIAVRVVYRWCILPSMQMHYMSINTPTNIHIQQQFQHFLLFWPVHLLYILPVSVFLLERRSNRQSC